MNQRFDHDSWRASARAGSADTAAGPHWHALGWHELSMRLAAAHALQRALARSEDAWAVTQAPPGSSTAAGGSFDPAAAARLAHYAPTGRDGAPRRGEPLSGNGEMPRSYGVNPIILGDRKAISGKELGIAGGFPAGFVKTGDRGLK